MHTEITFSLFYVHSFWIFLLKELVFPHCDKRNQFHLNDSMQVFAIINNTAYKRKHFNDRNLEMNPWEFGMDIAFSYNNLGPGSTSVECSDFFFFFFFEGQSY